MLELLLEPVFEFKGLLEIAMLGAIESLLCAVVLDGMSGIKHSANSELLGQGIGNIITPLFGGITATAALARSGRRPGRGSAPACGSPSVSPGPQRGRSGQTSGAAAAR